MKRALIALLSLITGCAYIPSPVVAPFADGSHWVLMEPLRYRLKDTEHVIEVPKGFVTDFASVPRVAWSVMSPYDEHGRAGIVHDWLYWEQSCSRKQADKIMKLGMIETRVSHANRAIIYRALRLAGNGAWNENAQERKMGLPRVISARHPPIPADAVWPEYRNRLYVEGERPPVASHKPKYCSAVDDILES